MQKYIKGIQYEYVLNMDTWAKVENSFFLISTKVENLCFLKIKIGSYGKRKSDFNKLDYAW